MEEIVKLMEEIVADRGVPRNVKSKVSEAKEALLNEEQELNVRVATAISILDEVSIDPNLPVYARTKIWNLVSKLEELRKS